VRGLRRHWSRCLISDNYFCRSIPLQEAEGDTGPPPPGVLEVAQMSSTVEGMTT
jgi:hypothetical protein